MRCSANPGTIGWLAWIFSQRGKSAHLAAFSSPLSPDGDLAIRVGIVVFWDCKLDRPREVHGASGKRRRDCSEHSVVIEHQGVPRERPGSRVECSSAPRRSCRPAQRIRRGDRTPRWFGGRARQPPEAFQCRIVLIETRKFGRAFPPAAGLPRRRSARSETRGRPRRRFTALTSAWPFRLRLRSSQLNAHAVDTGR